MTGRIVNEDGEYTPTVPVVEAPATIPARGLPQQKTDPYANVDATDFSNMDRLSKEQMIQLAAIAESRGQNDASLRWKMAAADKVRAATDKAERDKMLNSWEPKAMPAHGSQVIAVPGSTPWEQDSAYQALQGEVAAATEKAKAGLPPAQQLEADKAVADAQAALKDRETAIREAVTGSGQWTDQDERVLDAQRTMAEKTAAVEAQATGKA